MSAFYPFIASTRDRASSVRIYGRADGTFRAVYYHGSVAQKANVFTSLGHAQSDAKDWLGGDEPLVWGRLGSGQRL